MRVVIVSNGRKGLRQLLAQFPEFVADVRSVFALIALLDLFDGQEVRQ